MDAIARRLVLFGLVSTLVVNCSAAGTVGPQGSPSAAGTVGPQGSPSAALPSVAASGAPAMVDDAANGIAFIRPASWTRWLPNAHDPMTDGPLIYLSTDSLLSTCATPPSAALNPADSHGRACEWPTRELPPNGVLVTWLTTRILAPLPSAGEAVETNGAIGRLQIQKPGSCSAIGAEETLYVLVPIGQPKPWSNIAVLACLRGPDLATSEADVRAMLKSARVSP
jgi:hypothetical protein